MIAYVPPLLIDIRVRKDGSRRVRIWFPFVLLWPLLAILFGFGLLVTALLDLALFISGARYHHYTMLLLAALRVLGETRGTHVNAVDDDNHVHVNIY